MKVYEGQEAQGVWGLQGDECLRLPCNSGALYQCLTAQTLTHFSFARLVAEA